MAATVDVTCPNCKAVLKLPPELAGKMIRCKKCEGIFEVPDPHAAPAKPAAARPVAAKPAAARPVAAKPAAAAPVATAPPAADAPIPFKDEDPPAKPPVDDDDEANPYGLIKDDSEVPRCPHCAKDLDPPDARICTNCGYDLIERKRHATKAVYQATFEEYALHLLPGILCVILIITMLVIDILAIINMEDWMTDGMLDSGEKDRITQKTVFYIKPYCFNLWLLVITGVIGAAAGKFAYKRLVLNWQPEERKIVSKE